MVKTLFLEKYKVLVRKVIREVQNWSVSKRPAGWNDLILFFSSGRPDQSKEHPWCQQMKLASMNSCLCLDLPLKPLVLLRLQPQAVMRTLWFRFPHSIQIWFNFPHSLQIWFKFPHSLQIWFDFTCSIQPVWWWWYCISWTFKYTIQDRRRKPSHCILGLEETEQHEGILREDP